MDISVRRHATYFILQVIYKSFRLLHYLSLGSKDKIGGAGFFFKLHPDFAYAESISFHMLFTYDKDITAHSQKTFNAILNVCFKWLL